MSDYIFLFDLDSTVSREEILPKVSKMIGKEEEMRLLTEATMKGEIPFKSSFLERVNILKDIDVDKVKSVISNILLNEEIVKFIKENSDRCYILTGNLDVWIDELMKKIGMSNHYYSSKAEVKNNKISSVISVVDKELMSRQFVQPLVIIGDGDNDSGMAKYAKIAIGFGGVRDIADSLMDNIDFAFYDDKRCSDFLRSLL